MLVAYDSVPLGKSSERVESRNPYNAPTMPICHHKKEKDI